MSYRGRVINDQITLDQPARLPEGAEVRIEVIGNAETAVVDAHPIDGLCTLLLGHAGKGRDLPSDLAAHHDHYAHGKPQS